MIFELSPLEILFGVLRVVTILSSILLFGITLWLGGQGFVETAEDTIPHETISTVAYGVGILTILSGISIGLIVSHMGIPLALALALFTGPILFVGHTVAMFVAADRIRNHLLWNSRIPGYVLTAVCISIISVIPSIGLLVHSIFASIGTGFIVRSKLGLTQPSKYRPRPTTP